ncbi:ring-opening amidohydrolase [Pseudorhodoplanes sp.]|uniref:cyanuric acid amidohydrolase n=1 Tax=Pseudorhodoplanes sp. TaxID=1934341 RepID=UPI002BEC6D59|nr:ring-opening amidohydrolase [Pseudorhodoplanes sp.]HWV51499.1 ring-opening amidohydrolase [Pseudorhodoplanes sp.]
MRANVFRLPMQHPGDLSELEGLIAQEMLRADEIIAVIGKTEGNGGVNDFTRGFFTQTLMALLSRHLNEPADSLIRRIPCILSGGTEGVLTPHYVVLSRRGAPLSEPAPSGAFAIGTAMSAPVPAHEIGRAAHVESVSVAVRKAMAQAHIADPDDVHFVQVKCPCVTSARAEAARAAGKTVASADPNRSMALARAAGAFGVALALGEIGASEVSDTALLQNFSVRSDRASISSGVEVEANEVIVLGNSPHWSGDLRIAHRAMSDALDIGAVMQVLSDLDISAAPQVSVQDRSRVQAVFVKCEPDRRGQIRGQRHTMLDDTDINAQRHIRGAVGGLVAGVLGDTRIFVSGGAEHQGPDGGGLIAAIAEKVTSRGGGSSCAL